MYYECNDNVMAQTFKFCLGVMRMSKMEHSSYVQARIDPHIKEEARSVLDELGISMSEAIVVYLKQIILHRGIPFELKLPNKATAQAVSELESGKGVAFDSVDELLEDLEH